MKPLMVTIICLLITGQCLAQIEDYLPSVVRITAQKDFGEDIGAGIIIGQQGSDLYILTAYHVIAESTKAEVLLYRQKENHSVQQVAHHEDLDLAVLKMSSTTVSHSQTYYPAEEVLFEREKAVLSIGHPAGGFWKINSLNKIQETTLYEEERQCGITPQAIVGGCSGGPVFMENGAWLGMVTETSMIEGKCVKGTAIQKWIRAKNIPSQYLYFPEPEMVFVKGGKKRKFPAVFGWQKEKNKNHFYKYMLNFDQHDLYQFFEDYQERKISDFYMGRSEVTFRDFRSFIIATGYETRAESQDLAIVLYRRDGEYRLKEAKGVNWRHDVFGNTVDNSAENYPVLYVSFYDAMQYCKWLSEKTGAPYRLPLTNEWFYASSSETDEVHSYYFGNVLDDSISEDQNFFRYLGEMATGYEDGYPHLAPAGSLLPNEFGLYNMYGNVREWCFEQPEKIKRKELIERTAGQSWLTHFYKNSIFYIPNHWINVDLLRGGKAEAHINRIAINQNLDNPYNQATCFDGFRIVRAVVTEEDKTVEEKLSSIRPLRRLVEEEKNPELKVARQEAVVAQVEKIYNAHRKHTRAIKRLSAEYGNLSFYYLFTQQFDKAEKAARKGLKLYPHNEWIISNLAPALLFQEKLEEAEEIYSDYKYRVILLLSEDYPFEYYPHGTTYRHYFREDLMDLEKVGITSPAAKKILGSL